MNKSLLFFLVSTITILSFAQKHLKAGSFYFSTLPVSHTGDEDDQYLLQTKFKSVAVNVFIINKCTEQYYKSMLRYHHFLQALKLSLYKIRLQ